MKQEEVLITVVEALAPGLLRYCLGRSGNAALAEGAAQEALAALVALETTKGGTEVAGIEPTTARDQVRMERLTVQAGASLERVLVGIDGARIPPEVREAG